MVIFSWSVTLTCVMVTVACVASVCRVRPPTLALDRKLESHSAFSPGGRGGIWAGGVAGSNVRFAKATGFLVIVGTGASLSCHRDERSRHLNQPKISTHSNTQSIIERRESNTASAFDFPDKTAPEPRVCGGG